MDSEAVDEVAGPLLKPLGVDGVPWMAVGEWLLPFITAGGQCVRTRHNNGDNDNNDPNDSDDDRQWSLEQLCPVDTQLPFYPCNLTVLVGVILLQICKLVLGG